MNRRSIPLFDMELSMIEKGISGTTILFLHGSSLSSESFQNQLNEPQFSRFRLIAPDFPGHGATAKAKNPDKAYNLYFFRDLIQRLIKEINIQDYILVGHSLGGHVAMEMLQYPGRCKGLFLCGAPPVGLPLDTSLIFRADPRVPLMFTGSLTSAETDSLASLLTCKNHQEEIGRWIAKADPDFREMFPVSLTNHLVSDEYKLLRDSGLPTALVHGEKDALINISYLNSIHLTNLWQKQPVSIKDACHVPQMEKPEEFNSLLLHFVKSLL